MIIFFLTNTILLHNNVLDQKAYVCIYYVLCTFYGAKTSLYIHVRTFRFYYRTVRRVDELSYWMVVFYIIQRLNNFYS